MLKKLNLSLLITTEKCAKINLNKLLCKMIYQQTTRKLDNICIPNKYTILQKYLYSKIKKYIHLTELFLKRYTLHLKACIIENFENKFECKNENFAFEYKYSVLSYKYKE